MPTIPIILKGDASGAKAAFKDVSNSAQGMARQVGQGSTATASKMRQAMVQAARPIENQFKKTGAVLQNTMASVSVEAEKGGKGMNRMGNAAKAAFTAGAGAMASSSLRSFSDGLIANGDEAEAAGLKMEAMAAKLKIAPSGVKELKDMANQMSKMTGMDDDEFANVSAHMMSFGLNAKQVKGILPGLIGQARTMDQSLTSVADAFGKAYASGNAGALKKSGVVLEQFDLDRIKALKKAGKYAEAQALTYEAVRGSLDKYAIGANQGRSKAAITRGYFDVQKGNMLESMGQSAGRTRAAWQGAATPLMERINNSPGALNALGAGVEIGAQASPFLTMAATLGQAMPVFEKAGGLFGNITTNVGKIGQVGPFVVNALAGAKTGMAASGWAAVFSGNSHAAAALKTRMAGFAALNASGGFAKAGVALGALAATAYGLERLKTGMDKATRLSDDQLIKEEGTWGKVWVKGGRAVGNAFSGLSGENARGARLDAQLAELQRKRKARMAVREPQVKVQQDGFKRSPTGGGAARVSLNVHVPASPTDRAARRY